MWLNLVRDVHKLGLVETITTTLEVITLAIISKRGAVDAHTLLVVASAPELTRICITLTTTTKYKTAPLLRV